MKEGKTKLFSSDLAIVFLLLSFTYWFFWISFLKVAITFFCIASLCICPLHFWGEFAFLLFDDTMFYTLRPSTCGKFLKDHRRTHHRWHPAEQLQEGSPLWARASRWRARLPQAVRSLICFPSYFFLQHSTQCSRENIQAQGCNEGHCRPASSY